MDNWILEHGYVSPDAIGHREYHGSRIGFSELEEALVFLEAHTAKKQADFQKGSAVSVMVSPTENVNVYVAVINEPTELVRVIVVDDSPLYFLKLRYAISESAFIVKTASYLSNDVGVEHDPLFRFDVIDYYLRHFCDSSIIYDDGRFFNDATQVWVCPHCKTAYLDHDSMHDNFVLESDTIVPFVTHTSCDGVMFLGDGKEVHATLNESCGRINGETHDLYTYLHNGDGVYRMVCEYQDRCVSQSPPDGLLSMTDDLIDEMVNNRDSNPRTVHSVTVSRNSDGLFRVKADVSEQVFSTPDPAYLLAVLTCVDYAIYKVREREPEDEITNHVLHVWGALELESPKGGHHG